MRITVTCDVQIGSVKKKTTVYLEETENQKGTSVSHISKYQAESDLLVKMIKTIFEEIVKHQNEIK